MKVSFSRIKSKYKGQKNGYPIVELDINKNDKRTIDGFVVKGYTKSSQRFIKNLEKEFKGKTYDDKNLIAINKNFQSHQFVAGTAAANLIYQRFHEHLSFHGKEKTNTFDGVIGFGNDKTDKFTLNGTLNVNFRNMFNGFEPSIFTGRETRIKDRLLIFRPIFLTFLNPMWDEYEGEYFPSGFYICQCKSSSRILLPSELPK
jgi:hypothetical protein